MAATKNGPAARAGAPKPPFPGAAKPFAKKAPGAGKAAGYGKGK